MRTRLNLLASSALLALSACGQSPAGSSAPETAAVSLDRGVVTFSLPGETAAVTASAGGQSTNVPSFTVVSESRYLHDQPVLDPAALAAGQLRANGPGSTTVEVRAFGGAPARLEVRFAPSGPMVLSAVPDSSVGADGFRLRGYALDRAGAQVSVGSASARVVGGDSATLRILAPAAAGEACSAGEALRVGGAAVAPGVVIARAGGESVRLDVGQSQRLSAGAAGCLRLAAIPGARYALAFLDARQVRASRGGSEGRAPSPAFYSVSVSEAGRTAPAAAPSFAARRSVQAGVAHRTLAGSAEAGSPFVRAEPWREGERMVLRDGALGEPVAARVVRVYGGHLVFAMAEGDEPAGGRDAWVARADSAFAQLVQRGYPVLGGALTSTRPVTSAGSGQLLVLARREDGPYMGSTASVVSGGREVSMAVLNTAYGSTGAGVLRTLAHEVAHAWQQQYAWETRPGQVGAAGGTAAWASEGGAELLAWMVMRETRGTSLTGNWDWAAGADVPDQTAFALLAAGSRGDFTAGYASAASFQLDLVTRLVRRGVSEADALSMVARGSLEGWHGFDPSGARRAGLAERMRSRLGAAWDPAGALLTWTLSQALDDQLSDPELQNHTFRAVSSAGLSSARGWLPQAVLRSGAAAQPGHAASRAVLAGNSASLQWDYGSPNYFLLEDDGVGAAYRLRSEWNGAPLEATEWMIVRYR